MRLSSRFSTSDYDVNEIVKITQHTLYVHPLKYDLC